MQIKLSKIRGHTILRKMLGYEELICDKIIQNILNPKKSEGDEYDESRNEYSGVSHAEVQNPSIFITQNQSCCSKNASKTQIKMYNGIFWIKTDTENLFCKILNVSRIDFLLSIILFINECTQQIKKVFKHS